MSEKYLGETGLNKLVQLVKSALGGKVDAVSGKGLSTNDYTTADKNKLTALPASTDLYTKTEINQMLSGAMNYKGTKATTSELPSSGNATGDVWHVTADGSEWAWNGSSWEQLGTEVDLVGFTANETETIWNSVT